MPKFFFDSHLLNQNTILLSGDAAHHLVRVLRVRCGDPLTLCDGAEKDFCCVVSAITDHPCRVALDVTDMRASQTEPTTKVTLYQALPKGDKMDSIVQKSVELGVNAIVPVLTERTEVRDLKKERLARYQRIAAAAAEQSMRGIIPTVMPVMAFDKVVALYRGDAGTICTPPCNGVDADATLYMAYENERRFTLRTYLTGRKPAAVGVLIGPEGGFSDAEAAFFTDGASNRLHPFSLGPRVLRTETAGLAALAQITCLLEDLR